MVLVFILITHCVKGNEDIEKLISEHLCLSAHFGFEAKELQINEEETGIIIIRLM